jgi:hypothetical protein
LISNPNQTLNLCDWHHPPSPPISEQQHMREGSVCTAFLTAFAGSIANCGISTHPTTDFNSSSISAPLLRITGGLHWGCAPPGMHVYVVRQSLWMRVCLHPVSGRALAFLGFKTP